MILHADVLRCSGLINHFRKGILFQEIKPFVFKSKCAGPKNNRFDGANLIYAKLDYRMIYKVNNRWTHKNLASIGVLRFHRFLV